MARVRQLLFTRILLALMVTSAGMQEAMSGGFFRKDDFKDSQPVVLSQAEMDAVYLGEWPQLLDITVSSTHTDGRWRGMTWHYLGQSSRMTGEVEPFEISIVDGEDSELDNPHDTYFRNNVPYGNNDSALDVGDNLREWTCEYIYGCVKPCLYKAAAISGNQIKVAISVIIKRVRANRNKLALLVLAGQAVSFSVKIGSGIRSFYITNTLQKDPKGQLKDTCDADAKQERQLIIAMLKQVSQNIADLGARIKEGNCQSRVYDHYTDDRTSKVEGSHFRHAVKVQEEANPAYSDPYCR